MLLLPSLLSTTWGGYCLKQLIYASTHLKAEWKTCSVSWFEGSYIEDLSLVDPRTQLSASIKRIDSTWSPSSLLFSPRSIGITSIQGAHFTFSLPVVHQDKWPYPFIPSSLGKSHTSKFPFYGTLYIDTSSITCRLTEDQHMTLKNVTLSLLIPPKEGKIHCAFSATSYENSEAEKGILSLLTEYTPKRPRKLLQTDADTVQALAENRLYFDMQIRNCPSLLVDALLHIRRPDSHALVSKAIGSRFNCFIHTDDHTQTPHLAIAWDSPFLQGSCRIQPADKHLVLSTVQPIQWSITPSFITHSLKRFKTPFKNLISLQKPCVLTLSTQELILRPKERHVTLTGSLQAHLDPLLLHVTSRHIPLQTAPSSATFLLSPDHLHWDARATLEWEQKESPISSSGDYHLPHSGHLKALENMHISLEALPVPFLDLLFDKENPIQSLLGETIGLHVLVSTPPNETESFLRILFLAEKLQCDPIELALGTDLRLIHPFHIAIKSLSTPLQLTCESLFASSEHPFEAHFTSTLGKVALSLSTCTLPPFSYPPFKIVGHALFSPNLSSSLKLLPALMGSSLGCMFSATYDPNDPTASKAECFLTGEGIDGELACRALSTQEPILTLTEGRLSWKMSRQRFAALQEILPFLKEWNLNEEADWTFTAQKGPLPLSLEALIKNGYPITAHVDPLSLTHIPSQYALSLSLSGLLDENLQYHVHGSLPANEGIRPDFIVEGPFKDILHSETGITGRFTGHELPTSLCTLFTHSLPDLKVLLPWLWGKRFTLEGALAFQPDTRHITLQMATLSGMQFHIDATQTANRYTLNQPCRLKLPLSLLVNPIDNLQTSKSTEQLLRALQFGHLLQEIDSSNVLSLTLMPEESFLQLPCSTWDDIHIGQLIIEMGKVTLKLPKRRSILSGILPQDILTGESPFTLRTTPFSLSLDAGTLRLKRVDALVAERYPIAFWGKMKIPKNQLKATLAISALALRTGYGLSDISPGYYLLLPMSGSMANVSLHKTKALTRLTALSLHSNGGIPGAFLGSFAHWLGGGFDPDQIPPPTFPIPWSALEEQLEQQQREREKQGPNSLPGVLIAPFQAVHRGIQTGVRKGADLLFNFLR